MNKLLQFSNSSSESAVEARNHFKNGASSKSQMSRKNFNIFGYAFLTLVAVIALTSCTEKETTYTFKFKAENVSGVNVEATVFEYNNSDKIVAQQSFNCVKDLTEVVTADSKSTKVKVKLKLKAGANSSVCWIKQVFYLKDGKNIDVVLTGNTTVVEDEP